MLYPIYVNILVCFVIINGFTTIANPKVQQLPKYIDFSPNIAICMQENLSR
jgi:hypothetical protein